MSLTRITIVFAWFLASAAGCGDDTEPLFPPDFSASYQEVRDCRRSADHDLGYVRVLASPDALAAYTNRQEPFPPGAVVLKPEYADSACTDLTGYTVMHKEPAATMPDTGGWSWQRVTPARTVMDIDPTRCVACHMSCGVAPEGHDLTCALP